MRPMLLAVIGLSACASPQVYDYPSIKPGLKVVKTDQASVNRICRMDSKGNKGGTWDNGRLIMNGQNIAGCFQGWTNTIYVTYRASAETVLHEFCHASGRSRKDCDGI